MTSTIKAPVWFWIISVLALLWNLAGVAAYLQQELMTPEVLDQMKDAERTLLEATPAWATAAFAIAVWGGLLGSISLLLRKKWAKTVLFISLLGVLVQMAYAFFLSNSFAVYGPGVMIMPVMVILIAIILVFFAKHATNKNWIS